MMAKDDATKTATGNKPIQQDKKAAAIQKKHIAASKKRVPVKGPSVVSPNCKRRGRQPRPFVPARECYEQQLDADKPKVLVAMALGLTGYDFRRDEPFATMKERRFTNIFKPSKDHALNEARRRYANISRHNISRRNPQLWCPDKQWSNNATQEWLVKHPIIVREMDFVIKKMEDLKKQLLEERACTTKKRQPKNGGRKGRTPRKQPILRQNATRCMRVEKSTNKLLVAETTTTQDNAQLQTVSAPDENTEARDQVSDDENDEEETSQAQSNEDDVDYPPHDDFIHDAARRDDFSIKSAMSCKTTADDSSLGMTTAANSDEHFDRLVNEVTARGVRPDMPSMSSFSSSHGDPPKSSIGTIPEDTTDLPSVAGLSLESLSLHDTVSELSVFPMSANATISTMGSSTMNASSRRVAKKPSGRFAFGSGGSNTGNSKLRQPVMLSQLPRSIIPLNDIHVRGMGLSKMSLLSGTSMTSIGELDDDDTKLPAIVPPEELMTGSIMQSPKSITSKEFSDTPSSSPKPVFDKSKTFHPIDLRGPWSRQSSRSSTSSAPQDVFGQTFNPIKKSGGEQQL